MAYFYDTNILLQVDLNKLETPFYLSSVTLQELENIKTSSRKSEDIKYKARKATHWLQDNEDKYLCVPRTNSTDDYCEVLNVDYTVPDNQILSCAKWLQDEKKIDIIFATNDIACYNISKHVFGLKTTNIHIESDDYRGYCYKELTTNEFNALYDEYVKEQNPLALKENQYLIIKDIDQNKEFEYVYRKGHLEMLKLPKGIKALSSKQRCALDLLNNTKIPIKIIAGVYGSGRHCVMNYIHNIAVLRQELMNYRSLKMIKTELNGKVVKSKDR